MVKKSIKAEIKAFVKGLITEASPLNFPENASFDEANFELNRDGTRNRRLGMDYEANYLFRDPVTNLPLLRDFPINVFEWENAGSISGKTILVVQASNGLDFFDLAVSNLSRFGYLGSITLTTGPSPDFRYSMASVDGRLVVADGSGDLSIITYTGTGFTRETARLKVRDTWGISYGETDGDPTFNPIAPPDSHTYNLYNQSWGIPRRNEGTPGNFFDPVFLYKTTYSKAPSDSETVYTALQQQPVAPPNTPSERMFMNLFKEQLNTGVKAAKGYFIIDLLDRGASRKQAVEVNAARYPEMTMNTIDCPTDRTPYGANVVCEFAGRVFYAGFSGTVVGGDPRSPDLSNYVAFSMLVKNRTDITKCYQDGDPTSREGNDIVDTDGGLIRISGADGIMKMVNLGTSLIVFARNGVWAITGGSDYGFTATNYKVSRITKFGAISPDSVVEETGAAFYWSEDGIYVIMQDQMGSWTAQNITESTIQKYYQSINITSKRSVKGVYDVLGKKVRWIFSDADQTLQTYVTTELVFDRVLKAFYKHQILRTSFDAGAEVLGLFNKSLNDETSDNSSVKYLCMKFDGGFPLFTFSEYRNTQFRDWFSEDGVGRDAKAYLVTGAITGGDSSVAKQAPYLVMHMKRTETGFTDQYVPENPSGCLVRAQWDFTNTAQSNKWGPLFQVYRYPRAYIPTSSDDSYDTGYEVITTKSKLRGRGRALSLYMETESGKDCHILGWTIALNGNSTT